MRNQYLQKAAERAADKHAANEYRNALLAKAKEDGVGIVHIFDTEWTKGGMTVAFKKSNEFDSGCMVDVAVNTCSKEDTFSRALGTTGALDKFFDGQTIQLPLLQYYPKSELSAIVKASFTRLYAYI
jgi:hypothetical protein